MGGLGCAARGGLGCGGLAVFEGTGDVGGGKESLFTVFVRIMIINGCWGLVFLYLGRGTRVFGYGIKSTQSTYIPI